MNQRTDALHALVTTLSPAESAGFESSLTANRPKKGGNHFLLLFRCLKKMPRYDFAALTVALRGRIPADTVSSVKSQLKRRLIGYLRDGADTKMKQWHHMLEEADLLAKRGVHAEAYRLLQQVKAAAQEAGKPYYAIAALHLAGNVIQRLNEREVASATFALGQELDALAAEIQLTMAAYNYYATNVAINFRNSLVRDDASRNILRNLDAVEARLVSAPQLSPYQEYFYLMGKYVNARLKADFQAMHDYARRRMDFLGRERAYLDRHQPHSIPIVYLNLVESSMIVNSRAEWEMALSTYKEYVDLHYPGVAIYHGFYDYERYTFPIKNSKDMQEVRTALTALEESYRCLSDGIVMFKKLYEMTLGGGFYRVREYGRAFEYFQKLIQEEHSSEVGDGVDDVARLMSLISEFDRTVASRCLPEELIGFRSLVTSAYHHFRKKRDGDYRMELGFIGVFRAFAKEGSVQDILVPLEALRSNVSSWLDEGVGYVRQLDMSFDILGWVGEQEESIRKHQKSTFSKGSKEKAKKK